MRQKVTEGDLLLINVPLDIGDVGKTELAKIIHGWLRSRGMNDVTAYLLPMEGSRGISIDILSVNDVFENELLGGNKNG